jgi:hypothetical protein
MRRRVLWSLLKWPATLLALGGLLAAAYLVHEAVQAERAAEAGGDKVDAPRRAANGVVKLGVELAESHGLKDEPAAALSWHPRVPVYGRVVPNPQATAEVRAPFAGTLRADPDAPWPAPGRWVRAGQVLGRVDIRVGPQERLDLQAKLADARLQERGAEEVLQVQQERVSRLKPSSRTDVVPQNELDDALVKVADARTQLARSRAAVELWQKAVTAVELRKDRPESAWSELLTAPADGEVTELPGRPGMAVEPGGVIARVVDFRRPLVRLDLPPAVLAAGPPAQVELAGVSAGPAPLGGTGNPAEAAEPAAPARASLVGPAAQIDMASQLVSYWYEVTAAALNEPPRIWRPGLFVTAQIKGSVSRPQEAVSVPRGAVLFHQGRALVYVRVAPGKYERREVQILGREGDRWTLAAGVAAGEPVVYRQAQILLSEEFRGDVDND